MRGARRSVPIISIALTGTLALVILGPIITVVIWAFAEQWRYPNLLPTDWGFRHWRAVFARNDVLDSLTASLSISFVATTLSAMICWPAAYAFARLEFPFRRALLLSFLAAQAFPKFALLVTIAVFFLRVDLIGSFWGVVIIQMIGTLLFMIWIPTSAFRAIPPVLEEAALDLGASRLRIFLEVTLPQAAPALFASYVLAFTSTLFDVEGALLIGAPDIRTMPILMLQLSTQIVVQHAAVLCVVLWVPTVLLLLATRRVIAGRGIASGFGV
jgi:putative spermidine/putrescine transport system permease protein